MTGEYSHHVDEKGRLTIPARFREELGERFVVTKGLDHCLFVYPIPEWSAVEAKLRALPLTSTAARQFVRLLFSGAAECEPDKQGRVHLPPNLREHARIERDVVVIGVGTRAEVWARAEWERYSAEAAAAFEETAEKITDLGM